MHKLHTSNLWFGTDESYYAYCNAVNQLAELQAKGPEALKAAVLMAGGRSSDPFALPPMWQVQGSVGVVSIQGSLVSGTAGFMRLFGVTGYEDIKGALAEALATKEVKSIMLLIDSGGGAVNGVEDAGTFIRKVAGIKPVISYSDGSMASAAYWLGVSADEVFTSRMAQSGSVGTLIVHTEYSQMLKTEGIQKTIVKYGKYKALGNPFEPLSEEAKAELQKLADTSGKIFVDYAADRRGVTAENFQKTMGEGRVFMGEEAAKVGLVDRVMSFEEAIVFAKSLDSQKTTPHNPRNVQKDPNMKKANLSKQTLLAIAAGTALTALGLDAPEANAEGVKLDADAVAALTAEATEVQAAFAAAVTKASTDAVATAKVVSDAALVAEKAATKAATDKVALLEAGAAALTSEKNSAVELAASFASIAKGSIAVMANSLGVADTSAALTGPALLAEHDRLKEVFLKKFPAGGVAAINVDHKPEANEENTPPANFLALLPNRKEAHAAK